MVFFLSQLSAIKAQLAQLLSGNPDTELPSSLFDGIATVIFSRKRASIVDLTKTVFMDLCVKGLELRALTYDEGLLAVFTSLCENTDAAAWEVSIFWFLVGGVELMMFLFLS